jgi:hypothetical protein
MDSLTNTFNYERYGAPFRRGNQWFYSYNEGLKAQSAVYTIEGNAIDSTDNGTVFFDPNTLSEDGTLSVWISYYKSNLQVNTQVWSRDGYVSVLRLVNVVPFLLMLSRNRARTGVGPVFAMFLQEKNILRHSIGSSLLIWSSRMIIKDCSTSDSQNQ